MKKILFATVFGVLGISFGALANEYKLDEVKKCDGTKLESYTDIFECSSCPDICDLNGSSISGTLTTKFFFDTLTIPYENGKKEGIQKQNHKNGKLASEALYKDGKIEGVKKDYRDDGSVSYEASFKNGKLDGHAIHYYADGKLETDIVYKDGERDGLSRVYYKDGTLFFETTYKDGKMDGIQTIYYYPKDKVLKQEKEYKDDQFVTTRYYDENGNEVDEKTFTRMRM